VRGTEFIECVRRKIANGGGGKVTDRQLADRLGITVQSLSNWSKRRNISPQQMSGLLFKMEEKAVERAEQQAIRPIVEFFELDPTESMHGARYEIFCVKDDDEKEHPYLKGLRSELERYHGVYIFYDSRGRALYAGKARQLRLWSEINNAFNRSRTVQQIRRVDHPERRLDFRTSDEKRRQIRRRSVPLYDLAQYFSAYAVADGLISELESLLIRGFPNDLLNVRMEKFTW
jgi:hypothetical protein